MTRILALLLALALAGCATTLSNPPVPNRRVAVHKLHKPPRAPAQVARPPPQVAPAVKPPRKRPWWKRLFQK